MEFELSKSKLFFYVLALLFFAFQTTARRVQLLPLPSDSFTTVPDSNDTEPFLTSENTAVPSSNDTEPFLTSENTAVPSSNDTEPLLTDDSTTIHAANDTKPLFTNDKATTTAKANDTKPISQEVAKTTDDFFTPDIIQNPTSSPPQYFASSPHSQETAETNDDFFSPPATQNDMSSFNAPLRAPVPAPAATFDDDNILPSADLPHSVNPPARPPVVDESDDYTIEVAPSPPLGVLPSTYEADVEVDPELAEEIKAYSESQDDDDRQARTAVVVAGTICLVGVGGFMYKKRKDAIVKKSQYQCLNRRDQN